MTGTSTSRMAERTGTHSSPVSVLDDLDSLSLLCSQQHKLVKGGNNVMEGPPLSGKDDDQKTAIQIDGTRTALWLDSQSTKHQPVLFQQMEQRIRMAEQEAIRHRAVALLYQDELRRMTSKSRLAEGISIIEDTWREQRRAMRHLQEVMREHSALVALRAVTAELGSLKAIAVHGETQIVQLEIENKMLEQSLQLERQQNKQLAAELNTLDAENRQVRAKAELLGQRMAVAENERNCLRRRSLLGGW